MSWQQTTPTPIYSIFFKTIYPAYSDFEVKVINKLKLPYNFPTTEIWSDEELYNKLFEYYQFREVNYSNAEDFESVFRNRFNTIRLRYQKEWELSFNKYMDLKDKDLLTSGKSTSTNFITPEVNEELDESVDNINSGQTTSSEQYIINYNEFIAQKYDACRIEPFIEEFDDLFNFTLPSQYDY